ncbi:ABC transporter substrate-binding protein [Natronorubrum halophilum]|uniref:ABC transporter substrate-binding protein n=1 Tax=Natronorubrum halophilum TaxID=1702106 RepID=UPI0010C2186E|nr:ABC transporter substrate-binding protein [Natronorubrum halophilum]
MSDDTDGTTGEPTRRDTLKYGGALAAGTALAGCSELVGRDGDSEPGPTGDETYSVTISPVGTVEFDSIPEAAVLYDPQVADHLVALGQQDRIVSLGFPDRYYTGFYDELPGVEFDTGDLTAFYTDQLTLDKEILYELDADIHHLDPLRWEGTFDDADIEELEQNVAPFFCNRFSRAHGYQGDRSYEYYTLWELLDKYAQVYQVQSRSQALIRVREEMLETIRAELPPQEERPSVALVVYNHDEDTFGPYRLNGPGFGKAHTRPLGANDALAEGTKSYASDYGNNYSMEAMLEFDPDVMIHSFDWTNVRERTEAFFDLGDHPVGGEITAVQNGRLYAGGSALQGPIFNLFQVELSAKQIYPDLFGQPPAPDESVPESERLFDRGRVADIINGDSEQ